MKTSLAERAEARRGEEDRRKRDAGELLRLRGRVKELEALCREAYLFADWWELEDTYPIALRNRLKAAGRGETVDGGK